MAYNVISLFYGCGMFWKRIIKLPIISPEEHAGYRFLPAVSFSPPISPFMKIVVRNLDWGYEQDFPPAGGGRDPCSFQEGYEKEKS